MPDVSSDCARLWVVVDVGQFRQLVAASQSSATPSQPSSSQANPEVIQALSVMFAATLAALAVIWGFKQVLKLINTRPESE
jgi:hypothetical protein